MKWIIPDQPDVVPKIRQLKGSTGFALPHRSLQNLTCDRFDESLYLNEIAFPLWYTTKAKISKRTLYTQQQHLPPYCLPCTMNSLYKLLWRSVVRLYDFAWTKLLVFKPSNLVFDNNVWDSSLMLNLMIWPRGSCPYMELEYASPPNTNTIGDGIAKIKVDDNPSISILIITQAISVGTPAQTQFFRP